MVKRSTTPLFFTGTEVKSSGYYEFAKYEDGSVYPSPKDEEKKVYLTSGSQFPPVASQNKAAWWQVFS